MSCTKNLLKTSFKYERRYGHLLNMMIEIWSRGHGDPDAFMRLIISVISWYVGGVICHTDILGF